MVVSGWNIQSYISEYELSDMRDCRDYRGCYGKGVWVFMLPRLPDGNEEEYGV